MDKRWIIVCGFLAIIFPIFLHYSGSFPSDPYGSDASHYHQGAIHLLSQQFYSLDGVHPAVEREPGQSFFLAFQYLIFGIDHPLRVFLFQAIFTFIASVIFCIQMSSIVGKRAAGIILFLLVTSGGILQVILSLNRESLALSLLLLFASAYLADGRVRQWFLPVAMGILLGLLILTYYPFVFFIVPFSLLCIVDRRGVLRLAALIFCIMLIVGGWALRNERSGFGLEVIGSRRTSAMWYVRGEQAERIHGIEPFMCLWAEYISRDWINRSDVCSLNGVIHRRWPQTVLSAPVSDLEFAAQSGKAKIRRHQFSYLWFSVFEVLELHLPFVGGGVSHAFNWYITVTTALLYGGVLLGCRLFFDRRLALLLLLPVYITGVFCLTDAIPRYLIPVIFCYCSFAGIGYDRLFLALQHLWQRLSAS
jgi:hypothetical protein